VNPGYVSLTNGVGSAMVTLNRADVLVLIAEADGMTTDSGEIFVKAG